MIDSVLAPTVQNTTTPAFLGLRSRFDQIYLVISPPRCASTAFSRVFWQHERLRYYSHEPFEATYFMGRPTSDALQKLKHPIDLLTLAPFDSHDGAGALLVKEMPYQVGGSFPQLAALSEHPIIFLIRDPRLNISSRMLCKVQVHDSPLFPHIESGWEPLDEQIRWCQDMGQDYLLVDCTDFRNTPESVFAQIFERLDLDFDPAQLSWRPQTQVPLDNLNGGHAHLYGVSWPVPVFNLLTSQYQTCPAFLAKMGCAGMCIFA